MDNYKDRARVVCVGCGALVRYDSRVCPACKTSVSTAIRDARQQTGSIMDTLPKRTK